MRFCIAAILRCVLLTVRDDRLGGSLTSTLRLLAMRCFLLICTRRAIPIRDNFYLYVKIKVRITHWLDRPVPTTSV